MSEPTGTDVLLSLIDRLSRRVADLEAWQGQMAEEVVTKRVRAESADFTYPGLPEPSVRIHARSDAGQVTVCSGKAGQGAYAYGGAHLNLTADQDSAGVYAYSDEEILGVHLEAHGPFIAGPGGPGGHLLIFDGTKEENVVMRVTDEIVVTPDASHHIRLTTKDGAALVEAVATGDGHEQMNAQMWATTEEMPDGAATIGIWRGGNSAAVLFEDSLDFFGEGAFTSRSVLLGEITGPDVKQQIDATPAQPDPLIFKTEDRPRG